MKVIRKSLSFVNRLFTIYLNKFYYKVLTDKSNRINLIDLELISITIFHIFIAIIIL